MHCWSLHKKNPQLLKKHLLILVLTTQFCLFFKKADLFEANEAFKKLLANILYHFSTSKTGYIRDSTKSTAH